MLASALLDWARRPCHARGLDAPSFSSSFSLLLAVVARRCSGRGQRHLQSRLRAPLSLASAEADRAATCPVFGLDIMDLNTAPFLAINNNQALHFASDDAPRTR